MVVQAGAPQAPSVAPQQVGGHAALIHKQVLPGVVQRLPVSPLPALCR